MQKWIDIFKGGEQIDSAGNPHNGDKIIEKAIELFSDEHTPPVVVGHPKTNAPAFGWVKGLREKLKNGVKTLQAKIDQMHPGFAQALKDGAYKKRSAAFYPDGSLRHVGFLGAAPPAVKGLEDIAFAETGDIFEFNESEEKMTFKDFFEVFKFWKDYEGTLDADAPAPSKPQSEGPQYSEADIEALKQEAAEKERARVEAEFADKKAAEAKAQRAQTIKTFLQDKINQGAIPPAWVEDGLGAFMEQLDDGSAIEFSEGSQKSPYAWFKGFMDQFTEKSIFTEIAVKPNASSAKEDAQAQLAEDIAARA